MVIGGFADILLADLDEAETEQRDHLDSIRQNVDRLQRLVANALHASRNEADQFEAHPRPVRVGPFVEQLLARLKLVGTWRSAATGT